jgi:SAM-dependent methyltransferase
MRSTDCAICGPGRGAREVYPQAFNPDDLNPVIFSARRAPDRRHFRIVRCDTCGLVRSDPVAPSSTLAELYQASDFDYGEEVANLRRTYGRYLGRLDSLGGVRGSLLEIGCGNGFFLLEALARGYRDVRGVEPSRDAIELAAPEIRPAIVEEVMRPGLFEADAFDVVCLFQVFDHVPDPGALLAEIHRVLRPGGLLLFLNHNVTSLSSRLLGEHSPIIDIEHTYLYSPLTMSRVVAAGGFEVVAGGPATNTYSLKYLAHLLPLPAGLRRAAGRLLTGRAGRWRMTVPLGNLFLVARRPR